MTWLVRPEQGRHGPRSTLQVNVTGALSAVKVKAALLACVLAGGPLRIIVIGGGRGTTV
jgi:hypothetical protein